MAGYIGPSGTRSAAPGGLALVQAFLNSADIEEGTDRLADPGGVRTWLRDQGLPTGRRRPTREDGIRFIAVREALRDVLDARDGRHSARDAAEILADAARDAPLVVRFDPTGDALLRPRDTGVAGAIATILAAAADGAGDGTWSRLKICRNDACRWAFYDSSRNRSGAWCSMAVCGNRLKGRSFRARRRAAPPKAARPGRAPRSR